MNEAIELKLKNIPKINIDKNAVCICKFTNDMPVNKDYAKTIYTDYFPASFYVMYGQDSSQGDMYITDMSNIVISDQNYVYIVAVDGVIDFYQPGRYPINKNADVIAMAAPKQFKTILASFLLTKHFAISQNGKPIEPIYDEASGMWDYRYNGNPSHIFTYLKCDFLNTLDDFVDTYNKKPYGLFGENENGNLILFDWKTTPISYLRESRILEVTDVINPSEDENSNISKYYYLYTDDEKSYDEVEGLTYFNNLTTVQEFLDNSNINPYCNLADYLNNEMKLEIEPWDGLLNNHYRLFMFLDNIYHPSQLIDEFEIEYEKYSFLRKPYLRKDGNGFIRYPVNEISEVVSDNKLKIQYLSDIENSFINLPVKKFPIKNHSRVYLDEESGFDEIEFMSDSVPRLYYSITGAYPCNIINLDGYLFTSSKLEEFSNELLVFYNGYLQFNNDNILADLNFQSLKNRYRYVFSDIIINEPTDEIVVYYDQYMKVNRINPVTLDQDLLSRGIIKTKFNILFDTVYINGVRFDDFLNKERMIKLGKDYIILDPLHIDIEINEVVIVSLDSKYYETFDQVWESVCESRKTYSSEDYVITEPIIESKREMNPITYQPLNEKLISNKAQYLILASFINEITKNLDTVELSESDIAEAINTIFSKISLNNIIPGSNKILVSLERDPNIENIDSLISLE